MSNKNYQEIVNFIYAGKRHERQKKEVRKRFKISENSFTHILTTMTSNYLIYEDDTGHTVGTLDNKRHVY